VLDQYTHFILVYFEHNGDDETYEGSSSGDFERRMKGALG